MACILIVEDDDRQRLLYREVFEGEGYHVVEACEGREALVHVETQAPDVVVLDINLPGMDGLDILARIHNVRPRLPVVLNSAYAAYKDQFVSWIADAYVVKCSDPRELQAAVRDVLRRRQGR